MKNSPRKLILLTASIAFMLAAASAKEKEHNWQTATVISQNLSSQAAGAYAAPIGTGVIGVPLYRRTNDAVVETSQYRLEWNEVGRNAVILPVNGQVKFYQDGSHFVVPDVKNHKHKFVLVSVTALH